MVRRNMGFGLVGAAGIFFLILAQGGAAEPETAEVASAEPASDATPKVADATGGIPFKPGDVIDFANLSKIKGYIPEEFWDNRELLFFEGQKLEIGPFHHQFPQTEERRLATEKYGGKASIGPDDSLQGHVMGQPFPVISKDDPQAAVKVAWNMDYRHDALEGQASFFFSYWDQGEQLPLMFEGQGWGLRLANRPDHMETEGDIFNQETRMGAGGFAIKGPPDWRGIAGLAYRYKDQDLPRDDARDVDFWVYIPDLRRVRRISGSQRTDPIAGTDMTPEDQGGFQGVIPHFTWEYIGEADVLAPIDTRLKGYPYSKEEDYGPYGFSLANDKWQLRKVHVIEQKPKKRHPYSRKRLWVDQNTYQVLFAVAYDRRDELWKLIHLGYHWSERPDLDFKVKGTNSLLPSVNIVANVQTYTGVRIEVFDAQPTRLSRGKVRKRTDLGRLTREGR